MSGRMPSEAVAGADACPVRAIEDDRGRLAERHRPAGERNFANAARA